MSLHSHAARVTRAATAVAATCVIAGGAAVAVADNRPAERAGSPERAATGARYFDLEANKAASMRALGEHLVAGKAKPIPRHLDLEANKARSQAAR